MTMQAWLFFTKLFTQLQPLHLSVFVVILHFGRLLHFLVSQINDRPAIGNGGFPFSSMPNGNAYYSENN